MDLSNPDLNKLKPSATDKRIIAKYEFNKKINYAVLLNYKEIMYNLTKLKNKSIQDKLNNNNPSLVQEVDMLRLHKVNFRTAFKATSFCAICGKNEKSLHNHHIRPLKKKDNQKYIGYRGFDKVVASLGRKQIPICSVCHSSIHNGKYDNLSLNDIYDIRLVAPEGMIAITKVDTPPTTTTPSQEEDKNLSRFEIDEKSRTYFNSEFNNYLLKSKYDNKTI